ncbi:MAG: glycosyltransferase family 39 protein [Candidatus Acidiferrum sp.]
MIPNIATIRRQPCLVMVPVGLALRLARILIVRTYIIPLAHVLPPMSVGDPHFTFGYEIGSIAHSIVSGHGFGSPFGPITGPTAWIAPLYPYLCAATFKIFGVFSPASAFVLLLLNSVFSAVICVPLYEICERTVGRVAGLWAGWTWALLPYFWLWPTSEIWETSFVALLLAYLILMTLRLAQTVEAPARNQWLSLGLLWGVALLTNPVLLTVLPVSCIWVAYRLRQHSARTLRCLALALAACAVVVTPWLARNRTVFGQFVFIRSNFGFEFHLGNYHLSNGFGWTGKHPSTNKEEREEYARMGEIAYVASKRNQAIGFVRRYPLEFLELTAKRFYAFWSGDMISYGAGPLLPWLYGPFSLLTVFGMLLAVRDKVPGMGLLFGLMLLFPLPFYLAFPQARNRYTIEPEMLALSVYFLFVVVRRFRVKGWLPHVPASPANIQEVDCERT